MKIDDAANILGLTGDINPDIVKTAYRKLVKEYHPDLNPDLAKNPAGAEMIKVLNNAYDALKEYTGTISAEEDRQNYPEALEEALSAIIDLQGLEIEICGAWVWVTGDTFTHKDVLREAGFKYASKKKAWNFRPESWKSRSRGQVSMDDIREQYGSLAPRGRGRARISYAGT